MNESAARRRAGSCLDATPLLKARDLSRTFGETRALDSCSLLVAPGEIHALVGENGSGKRR